MSPPSPPSFLEFSGLSLSPAGYINRMKWESGIPALFWSAKRSPNSHYGSAASALGHTVRVANRVMPIIGVLPARFHFPGTTDVWFPANTLLPESTIRGGHNVQAVAKLKPRATLTQAQAELTAIGDRLENQYPCQQHR